MSFCINFSMVHADIICFSFTSVICTLVASSGSSNFFTRGSPTSVHYDKVNFRKRVDRCTFAHTLSGGGAPGRWTLGDSCLDGDRSFVGVVATVFFIGLTTTGASEIRLSMDYAMLVFVVCGETGLLWTS